MAPIIMDKELLLQGFIYIVREIQKCEIKRGNNEKFFLGRYLNASILSCALQFNVLKV